MIELIHQGNAPRIRQDEPQATYEDLCQEKDAIIDWAEPISKVYNLIRGTNPQPGATIFLRGNKLKIFDSEPVTRTVSNVPGEIVESDNRGIVIAGEGGCLLVKRVQPYGSPKTSSAEFAVSATLRTGERLAQGTS
ncbi:hypothetical protein ACFLXK_01405 [Chloroflexota bacterium]